MGEFEDLTGRRYGLLTVLHRAENRGRQTFWACKCDCGGYIETRGADLKRGSVKSCGCLRKKVSRTNTFVDITGKKFGRLTAIECVGSVKNRALWLFECECGRFVVVNGKDVRTGNTKSCGCLKDDESGFKPGSLHPQYTPDLSDEERQKGRSIPGYMRWTKAVYRRFNYTCQKCKRRGGKIVLHAHHIESYASEKELRTSLKNGIVLCKDCHYAFHGKYGRKTNREQLIEFLKEGERVEERTLGPAKDRHRRACLYLLGVEQQI